MQLFERRFKCAALAQNGNRFSACARDVVAAKVEAAQVEAGVAPKSGDVRWWALAPILALIWALILALIWALKWALNLALILCGGPHFSYRPWTLDFDPIEARSLRDAVPSIDGGVVWRRGSASRPEVVEFI